MATVSILSTGQVLISSALTQVQITTAFQNQILSMLNLTTAPNKGWYVRQAWQKFGAPAWGIDDDVVFVRCSEQDNDYNKVRDEAVSPNNDVSLNLQIEYTRVWRVTLELRGPNAPDRARLLRTCFQLDHYCDTFALSNLYLMPSISSPVRSPEFKDGAWWERTDFNLTYYEQVNESTLVPKVASVPFSIATSVIATADIAILPTSNEDYSVLTLTATQTISAFSVVCQLQTGLTIASSANLLQADTVLGITRAGALAGTPVEIQVSGPITNNGWNWTLGQSIYVGLNGALTQTPPTSGFSQIVGLPVNATTFVIEIQSAIILL